MILSQDALGLRFHLEHSFPLKNAAPRIGFCAVSEIGPMWVPPPAGYGWEVGPVQTKPFHAKSAFSAKENTFGFDFHLWTPPA